MHFNCLLLVTHFADGRTEEDVGKLLSQGIHLQYELWPGSNPLPNKNLNDVFLCKNAHGCKYFNTVEFAHNY